MRWLVCLAVLVAALTSSEFALAQRGTVVRPASPPPVSAPPAPRVEPLPRIDPMSPAPWSVPADAAGGGDTDGDGWSDANDCNAYDPAVHPGAVEGQTGRDMNCDGVLGALPRCPGDPRCPARPQ
jgi:hypothetical protein